MATKRREPAVISLALITTALEEEANERPVESSVARPAIKLDEAASLQLSFRNILRIENLHLLKSLRKLQLDNNALLRIEGLETLSNLEWLDLSFNKIKKIEGLEGCGKVRDLSLYNNEITTIENLECLSGSLQCLSLGNNHLQDLQTVLYFRKLAALEVLTLEGNPLCRPMEGQRESYKVFCAAFLPRIKYLDYQMVTGVEKAAARDGGVAAERLQEVEEKDLAASRVQSKARERAAMVASLADANIEVVETLVDELFEDDPEFAKIRHMPGLVTVVQGLRDALAPAGNELRSTGLAKDEMIRSEVSQFNEALQQTVGAALHSTTSRMVEWERRFKHASREHAHALELIDAHHHNHNRINTHVGNSMSGHGGQFNRGSNSSSSSSTYSAGTTMMVNGDGSEASPSEVLHAASRQLHELTGDASSFESWALQLEVATHEAVEAMLDVYDSSMGELKGAKLANHETFFRAAEAAEAAFSEALQKTAERNMADATSGALPSDLEEDLASLLADKEALMSCLASSHEGRVARILKREGDLKAREDKRCGGGVTAARLAELQRNRDSIIQTKTLAASCKKRVEAALARAHEEDGQ